MLPDVLASGTPTDWWERALLACSVEADVPLLWRCGTAASGACDSYQIGIGLACLLQAPLLLNSVNVCCVRSLGAGAAALVSLKLREHYPGGHGACSWPGRLTTCFLRLLHQFAGYRFYPRSKSRSITPLLRAPRLQGSSASATAHLGAWCPRTWRTLWPASRPLVSGRC